MINKTLLSSLLTTLVIISTPAQLLCENKKGAACPAMLKKQAEAKKQAEEKKAPVAQKQDAPKSHSGVIDIKDKKEFDAKIKDGNVVVKFSTKWCPPCKKFAPIFKEVAAEMPHITFIAVDTEEADAIASAHNIRSIPTVKYFKGGKEVKTNSGGMSKKAFSDTLKDVFKN